MTDFLSVTISNSSDLFQRTFSFYIISSKLQKSLLAFAYHNSGKLRKLFQQFLRIKRNLRASDPEGRTRKYFLKIMNQILNIRDVPNIAGKAHYFSSAPVNILQNLILCLIDSCLLYTSKGLSKKSPSSFDPEKKGCPN